MSGDQSNAAAERSAHVERGSARRIPGEAFLLEVSPGVFQLKALVEALREVERLRAEVASLRLTLGGRTFGASVPDPVGCPAPGACAQVAEIHRLRAALKACADDLEGEVCARYAGTQDLYPSERRRFERDMEAVTAARQLLAGSTS
jgi:hypothetical protein